MTAQGPQSPGVSIFELPTSSLSVQGSTTAVPVFIGRFFNLDGTPVTESECIRVNSSLEFTRLFSQGACEVSAPFFELEFAPWEPWIQSAIVQSCKAGEHLLYTVHVKDGYAEEDFDGDVGLMVAHPWGSAVFNTDFVGDAYYFTDKNPTPKSVVLSKTWNRLDGLEKNTRVIYLKVLSIQNGTDTKSLLIDFSTSGYWYHRSTTGFIYNSAPVTYPSACSFFSVLAYFQNGGGPCYILPLSNKTQLNALPAAIEKYPDSTLLVCAETEEGLTELGCSKVDVYTALSSLLTPTKGYFLIADADSQGAAPPALADSAHAAAYYPDIVTTLKRSRPTDNLITISDYPGGAITFEALSSSKVEQYQIASAIFDQSLAEQDYLKLPPSALIAGAYARNDRERGVWKAPANISLKGVQGLETVVSEVAQGPLNQQGINVIRWFSDRGPVVYGARTLAVESDEWRYVPVRRLFSMVERDIQKSLQTLVFEPNNQATWERVRSAIYNYLANLWRDGALLGNSEKEAFFVQVGLDTTMTQTNIDNGQLIVKVGMAAVRPAEFIILQFTQSEL